MRLTVKLLQVKAKKLKYTLVVCSSGQYKYSLYYGSGKKRILSYVSNILKPVFEHLEKIEKARHENNA